MHRVAPHLFRTAVIAAVAIVLLLPVGIPGARPTSVLGAVPDRPGASPASVALSQAEQSLTAGAGPSAGGAMACAPTHAGAECAPVENAARPVSAGAPVGAWQSVPGTNSFGAPLPAPSERDMLSMAYDPALGAVVLFSGYGDPSVGSGDTWIFTTDNWTDLSGQIGAAPPARWAGQLVWDAADGYLLLFGGRNFTQFFNDTWEFNGTAWRNLTGPVAPSPRGFFQMAYDAADQYVVLYGGWIGNDPAGTNSSQQEFSDTWSYVGGSWTNLTRTGPAGPPAIAHGGAAYDPTLGLVVIYGGTTQATFPWACLPVDQAWGYGNGTWRNLTGTFGTVDPGPLSSLSLVYADTLGQLFLFGGVVPVVAGGCDSSGATYEMANGSTTWVPTSGGPIPRDEAAMTYDAALGETVLFGGNVNNGGPYLNDTWVFNFSAPAATPSNASGVWSPVATPTAPSHRDMAPMAYDPALGAVVLFGGYDPAQVADGDTWLFANGSWTDISGRLLNSPPARWADQMAWDAGDGYLVLFGGRNMTQFFNDTWAFTGVTWQNLTRGPAPSPRGFFQMAFDGADRYVLLYGGWIGNVPAGTNSSQQQFSDTWSFAGGNWTNRTASVRGPAPGPIAHAGVAYDPGLGLVVLYGGTTQATFPWACLPVHQAWGYANGTWQNLGGTFGPGDPGPLSSLSMVYAGAIGQLFLFGGVVPVSNGGCDSSPLTFEMGNGTSSILASALAPIGRDEAAMAYDPAENATLLFGGNVNNGGPYLNDTWVCRFPATNGSGGGSGGSGGNGSGFNATAAASVTAGISPLVVTFSVVTVRGVGPWVFSWTFGDGAYVSGASFLQHTYMRPGLFTPEVNVTDATGAHRTVQLAAIHVSPSPGSSLPSGGGTGTSTVVLVGAVGVGAILGAGAGGLGAVLWLRRRDRTAGEAIVQELADSAPPPPTPGTPSNDR